MRGRIKRLEPHWPVAEEAQRVDVELSPLGTEVQACRGGAVRVRGGESADPLSGLDAISGSDRRSNRLVRRAQPAVIHDDDAPPSHRSGKRHLSRRYGEDRLAGPPGEVDAAMAWTVEVVRRSERGHDRRLRVEWPEPGRPVDCAGIRAERNQP